MIPSVLSTQVRQGVEDFLRTTYHVTCRMIGDWHTDRARLFKDDADYWRFLDRLGERVETFHVRLYLFTCMVNHFHLVLMLIAREKDRAIEQ